MSARRPVRDYMWAIDSGFAARCMYHVGIYSENVFIEILLYSTHVAMCRIRQRAANMNCIMLKSALAIKAQTLMCMMVAKVRSASCDSKQRVSHLAVVTVVMSRWWRPITPAIDEPATCETIARPTEEKTRYNNTQRNAERYNVESECEKRWMKRFPTPWVAGERCVCVLISSQKVSILIHRSRPRV